MIVMTALTCLALNIYHEARGEFIPGQYAVAYVTMNRAQHDPDQICKTVFKPKQFSWTNKYVTRAGDGWKLHPRLVPTDQYAWWKATRVAAHTLNRGIIDITGGADHYHTTSVKPGWSRASEPIKQFGRHVFYKLY